MPPLALPLSPLPHRPSPTPSAPPLRCSSTERDREVGDTRAAGRGPVVAGEGRSAGQQGVPGGGGTAGESRRETWHHRDDYWLAHTHINGVNSTCVDALLEMASCLFLSLTFPHSYSLSLTLFLFGHVSTFVFSFFFVIIASPVGFSFPSIYSLLEAASGLRLFPRTSLVQKGIEVDVLR